LSDPGSVPQPRLIPTPTANDHRSGKKMRKDNNLTKGGVHGVSLNHLTENSVSTSSPEDTLASLSPMPGSAEARAMTVISGRTCLRSLPSSSPSASFWRTLVDMSAWDSTRCYLTWKTSATPAHRPLFRLLPSTRRTAAIESGLRAAAATLPLPDHSSQTNSCFGDDLWPTPTTASASINALTPSSVNRGRTEGMALAEAVSMFPTPDATNRPHEGNVRLLRQHVVAGTMTEDEAAAILGKSVWDAQGKVPAMWPTPRAGKTTDEDEAAWQARADRGDVATPPLSLAVKMWATPRTEGFDAGRHRGKADSLHSQVKQSPDQDDEQLWWTPSVAMAHRDWVLSPEMAERYRTIGEGNLNEQVASTLYPTPDASGEKFRLNGNSQQSKSLEAKARRGELDGTPHQTEQPQRLHARWVSRMMGLPDDWLEQSPAPLLDPRWQGQPLAAFNHDWEAGVPRVVAKEDERVSKLKALGNGIVPQVAFLLLVNMDKAGW